MILLDSGHQIIKDAVLSRLGPSKVESRGKDTTMLVSDFDDATYCIKGVGDAFTIFVKVHAYDALVKYGVEEYLRKIYSGEHFVLDFNSSTQQSVVYDFSLTLDLAPDFGDQAESIADQVSCVKRNVLAGPFMWYFNAMKTGATPSEALKIPFRSNEAMVVAEVFLREFADARRDSALQLAPAVSFSRTAPRDLDGQSVEVGEGICYISFALFKRHLEGKTEASVSAICQFRNYLHYHIKCSKAFMHMRMRKRVDDLLTVLNRAKLPAEAAVEKKAWGGRSVTK